MTNQEKLAELFAAHVPELVRDATGGVTSLSLDLAGFWCRDVCDPDDDSDPPCDACVDAWLSEPYAGEFDWPAGGAFEVVKHEEEAR